MNKLLLVLGVTLLVFGSLLIGGYHYFGIGGAFVGLLLFLGLVKLAAGVIKRRFLGLGKALFESKSKVLRGATVQIHAVQPAPVPTHFEAEEEQHTPATATRFVFVDCTITPAGTPANAEDCTPFACWDSSELQLVAFDAPAPTYDSESSDEHEGPQCEVHDVQCLDSENEDSKRSGAQHLKLHVAVPEGLTRLKFQYYFETFGDVTLPG
jgi:hypothetical protein